MSDGDISERDLLWLAHSAAREGKQLAKRVRRGQLRRADVEAARKQFPNDLEPVIALQWLDKWGIQ